MSQLNCFPLTNKGVFLKGLGYITKVRKGGEMCKLVLRSLFLFHKGLHISLILAVFIQRRAVCFPARAAQCSDSLGADIKNTVAGQVHLVLQSPEHSDIVLVCH